MDETKWYLPSEYNKNVKWRKRNKIPQWYIDLMNGKSVKIKLNFKDFKDWRFTYGSIK